MKILKSNLCFFLILMILSCSTDSENDIQDDDLIVGETNTLSTIETEVLRLINKHRVSEGLISLEHNEIAYEIALKHTNYMISTGRIGHDNFSERFDELSERLGARTAGENVASGYRTANEVVEAWLNSSGHRVNIEGDFTHTGINIRENENGTYYFTNIFYK